MHPDVTAESYRGNTKTHFETIGDNSRQQNFLLADVYERKFNVSLGKHLDKKCESKLHLCLKALCMPTATFIAWRLHKAMKSWVRPAAAASRRQLHHHRTRARSPAQLSRCPRVQVTDNSTLINLLGGIDGDVMDAVAVEYEVKYSKPLEKARTH